MGLEEIFDDPYTYPYSTGGKTAPTEHFVRKAMKKWNRSWYDSIQGYDK